MRSAHVTIRASNDPQTSWSRCRTRRWSRADDPSWTSQMLANMPSFPRAALSRLTAHMIDRLDEMDGDAESEDGDVDGCWAGDDDVGNCPALFGRGDGYPGDEDDAEDGEGSELAKGAENAHD
ncbi:hypothetical protein [Sphingomonas paeninsulae]|nr:hypothetical protein [Sphingomonas paeninsulae]